MTAPDPAREARQLARLRYWLARRFDTHARGQDFIRRVYPLAFRPELRP